MRTVENVAQLRQAITDVRAGRLRPGSVIRLSAARFRLDRDGPPLDFTDISGTSEDCPITLEGSGTGTVIDGGRSPMSRFYRDSFGPKIDLKTIGPLDQGRRVAGEGKGAPLPHDLINCVRIERSSWIVIRNLSFIGCWPSAVLLRDAKYITIQDVSITGATYAVIAYGATHHALIEDSNWTQDESGDVWSRIPWGISHHGSRSFLNGALFGSWDIKGSVVIRRNHVRHAFNGVRMKGTCGGKRWCDQNMNVEIYGNRFEFIRDNPVEPEHMAANWWIHHNRMQDVHAAFSFDGVRGGPHYVFGNTGWFTELPENDCVDAEWVDDRDMAGVLTEDRQCRTHRTGKTFKLGNRMRRPLYIFHNSWLLRSPIVDGGKSGPIRAWNNAVMFCITAVDGETCVGSEHASRAKDKHRFIWKLRSDDALSETHDLRFNMSNDPSFSAELWSAGSAAAAMHVEDVGFLDARTGDFRLRDDSPARDAGCIVYWSSFEVLKCRPVPGFFNIGAILYGGPVKEPTFRHKDGRSGPDTAYVERPRVVAVGFDAASPKLISVKFSVPVRFVGGSEVAIGGLRPKGQRTPISMHCNVSETRPELMICDSLRRLSTQESISAILLPRNIYRHHGRQTPVTLWAKPDPRLGFVD